MTTEELIEKIKRVIADPEGLTRSQLETLASEYASRCRRLNAKLDRAVACVRSGQLCEAERIERDGKLVAELQNLSFEEDSLWRDVCRGAGCDVTAQVSVDAATELQLFVLKYDEVKDVFKKYRRLSLEVGPAGERLDLLYQLRAKFPKAQTIARSIEALEDERIDEISERLKKVDSNNPPKEFLETALAELENPVRIKPAPEQMLQSLRAWVGYTRNQANVAALRQFIVTWAQAKLNYDDRKSREDENKVLECYSRYKSSDCAALLGALTPDEREAIDALCREAKTIERKRAASAELKRKTTELARAAKTSHDVDQLTNLKAAAELTAENAESYVDKRVADEVEKRIETLQLQKSRRSTMLVGTAAVLILTFSAAILFSIHRAQFQKDADQAAKEINAQLDEFIEKGYDASLEEARKKAEDYEKRKPKFNSVSSYHEAVARVKKIAHDEEQRAFSFKEDADDVERFLNDGYPRTPDFLKTKARTVEERERYAALSKLYLDVLAAYNDDRDEKNQELLDALEEKYREAQDLPIAKRRAAVYELKQKIALYKAPVSGEPQEELFIQQLDALEEKLDAMAGQLKQEQKNNELIGELKDQIGVVSKYNESLATLQQTLDEADSKLADLATQDVDNVSRAKVWNNFIVDASSPLNWTKNAAAFEKVAAKTSGAKDALSFAPEYEELATKVETWRAFGEAGGFETLLGAFEKVWEPYATPLWLYRDSQKGEYAYLTSKPESPDSQDVMREFGEGPKKYDASKLSEDDIKSISEAFQYTLYQEVKQKSFADDPQALVDEIVSLIRRVGAAPEDKLDPLLKAQLLSELLKACKDCPGLDYVNARFEDEREEFASVLNANFYKIGESKEQRENATKLLDNFGSVDKKLDDAAAEFAKAIAPIKGTYEWVGYVDSKNGDATVVFGAERPKNGQSLWIARGASSAAVECGTVVDKSAELNASRNWDQYRWSPVYARSEESASN